MYCTAIPAPPDAGLRGPDADRLPFELASGDAVTNLTPREREILRLVAHGLSNAAIADALVVSERTVDSHIRAIYRELGLWDRPRHNRRVLAALNYLAHGAERRPAARPGLSTAA